MAARLSPLPFHLPPLTPCVCLPVCARAGLVLPSLTRSAIPTACGLLGAIIMPHNLFLHSALVHSRWGAWEQGLHLGCCLCCLCCMSGMDTCLPACLPARLPACLPAWIASLLHLCVLCAQSHQVDAMPAHTHACRPVDASGSASSGAMPAHRSPAAKKVRLPG